MAKTTPQKASLGNSFLFMMKQILDESYDALPKWAQVAGSEQSAWPWPWQTPWRKTPGCSS